MELDGVTGGAVNYGSITMSNSLKFCLIADGSAAPHGGGGRGSLLCCGRGRGETSRSGRKFHELQQASAAQSRIHREGLVVDGWSGQMVRVGVESKAASADFWFACAST